MNKLRKTIQSQEAVVRDQQTRIAELEGILEDKDLLIVSMTAEGRREKALCETKKEEWDAEISECQAEKTRVREEFATKGKERCKAEKTHENLAILWLDYFYLTLS